ncbi:RNA polymerase sigma-70 factor (ECF subfamily) [Methylobacterium sp. BE186]|uniref:sigma-70 family RNA polymerase sigma factor n=1 Tax=Methylobacterium sp. BE186 TaxID=2817715 RepID=UPI002866D181|nr:sigma-70 family RNA polymerase sigma factor [Methylobacterium sp. BE186]MDR7037647.1 RNA polymerase sigma-70 factor (ECF subfamily) [Methylobacterium sp. BE186]
MAFHSHAPTRPGESRHGRSNAPTAGSRVELPAFLRDHLGLQLRALYAASPERAMPTQFLTLIEQLGASLDGLDPADSIGFRDELLALLPDLRVFARSIVRDASQADDLVQETLLRAWQNQHRYRPGSNFKAWAFTILRNQFYTERRRSKREVEDVDGAAAGRLVAPSDQVDRVALQELWARIRRLPLPQQEALILVAAQGMTYEEASSVIGCQVGTVKSRVSRAREVLAGAMGQGGPKLGSLPA